MTLTRTLQIALATAVRTAAAAQSALAGGEPKNTTPFTRPLTSGRSRANLSLTASAIHRAWAATQGEAKNEAPFTDPVSITDGLARYLKNARSTTSQPLGEPKNEPPFTRRVSPGA